MHRSLMLVLFAAACGTTDAAPPSPPVTSPQAAPAPATTDYQAACVEIMTRNRACTDEYLPALVDLRARYDQPPGIAARVREDRDAVIAVARSEWANDSTDEAIAATCRKLVASLPEEQQPDAEGARACVAEPSCDAYVACVTPFFEKRFTK